VADGAFPKFRTVARRHSTGGFGRCRQSSTRPYPVLSSVYMAKPAEPPSHMAVAHASLTYLEPTDTLSDTLWRGQSRFSADEFPIWTPNAEYRTAVHGHRPHTEDELENRRGLGIAFSCSQNTQARTVPGSQYACACGDLRSYGTRADRAMVSTIETLISRTRGQVLEQEARHSAETTQGCVEEFPIYNDQRAKHYCQGQKSDQATLPNGESRGPEQTELTVVGHRGHPQANKDARRCPGSDEESRLCGRHGNEYTDLIG
jgi:hypothetical protein